MFDIAQTTRLHREGLLRVAKIVDANQNYDSLLEYRLSGPEWSVFTPQSSLRRKRDEAKSMFRSKFGGRKHKIILPDYPGIACDGKTYNNLREFRFFEKICASVGVRILDHNYGSYQSVSISGLQPAEIAAQKAVASDVDAYYESRDDITASLVRQQILYSRSFFSFLLSFSRPGAILPSALVQANDHSPASVALSMALKNLAVPRIYLQHAEVTPGFPALDFEYSVLRNEQSRQIYEAITPPSGRVYVIPRYDEPFARECLGQVRGPGVTVVLYPTSRVLPDELGTILRVLNGNVAVSRVLIKQHPGAANRLDHALSGAEVEVIDAFPSEDHIAIVGNSSVAIELLHRGIPVYQNFTFDPVHRDYYGLVARGITQEVTTADLTEIFWRPYTLTEDWSERYLQLDPTAGVDYVAEQAAFVSEMEKIVARPLPFQEGRKPMKGHMRARFKALAKRSAVRAISINKPASIKAANLILATSHKLGTFLSVNSYYAASFLQSRLNLPIKAPVWSGAPATRASDRTELIEFLEHTLSDLDTPADWIRHNDAVGAFDAEMIIAAVEAMFQNRNPALNEIFQGYPEWPQNSGAGTWIYLKKSEWGNLALDHEVLEAITDFIYSYEEDARVRALLEASLLKAILRSGTGEHHATFWKNASIVRQNGLGFNTRMAVVRKLRSLPGHEAEAERALQDLTANASPFERLKLENMAFFEGKASVFWNHAYAEERFSRLAPSQIAREFSSNVLPVYHALRPRMRFMNVRVDRAEAHDLIDAVRAAIENRQPFSLIRLSDGEGYLFPQGRYFTASDAANRERHWWGTELPGNLRETIVSEARKAIASADVVGIPAIYRFIRDFGDSSVSLTQTVQGRGLLQVLDGIDSIAAPTAVFSEDKVNVSLFSARDELLTLAKAARKLILVSSVDPSHLPTELIEIPHAQFILLPTHTRTALNDKYNRSHEPLPFAYPELLERLKTSVRRGDLVLVAGGIIGKTFVGCARENGGVAIDIGSVIDDWVSDGDATLR